MKYLPIINILPDPRQIDPPDIISFSRNSRAYCIGSDGYLYYAENDEIRHEFNGSTKEYLGWLIENSAVNQIGFSEYLTAKNESDIPYWLYENRIEYGSNNIYYNVTDYPYYHIEIAEAGEEVLAPNKTYTAFKLRDSTSSTAYRRIVYKPQSFIASSNIVFSIYAKANEYNTLKIETIALSGKNVKVAFNLNSGLVTDLSGTLVNKEANIEALADGWYRLSVRYNTEIGSTQPIIRLILLCDSNPNEYYPGSLNSGLYLWGPQLEYGQVETSYIPTNTIQPEKREADDMSFSNLDWLNLQQGSFIFESSVKNKITGIHRILNLLNKNPDSFENDEYYTFAVACVQARQNLTLTTYDSLESATVIVPAGNYTRARIFSQILVSTYPDIYEMQEVFWNMYYEQQQVEANIFYKMALSYANNDVKYFLNGVPTIQDNYCQLPSRINMSQIGRGDDNVTLETGGEYLNGHIRRILYYNSKLSEDFLMELTK